LFQLSVAGDSTLCNGIRRNTLEFRYHITALHTAYMEFVLMYRAYFCNIFRDSVEDIEEYNDISVDG